MHVLSHRLSLCEGETLSGRRELNTCKFFTKFTVQTLFFLLRKFIIERISEQD